MGIAFDISFLPRRRSARLNPMMLTGWFGENHKYSLTTRNISSLAPLGESGDRKAGGEGVDPKLISQGQNCASLHSSDPPHPSRPG